MASSVRDKVFLSYSKDDEKWLDQLIMVLKWQIRANWNAVWWDGRIKAGQVWRDEIQRALESAKVAVLLVSPGFLASEFILSVELPRLLDDAKNDGVMVLWSLVRNCPWERADFSRYQAVRHQEVHAMKAWNALSEAELDDLLKSFAGEIEDSLRSDLGPSAAKAPAGMPSAAAGVEAAVSTLTEPRQVAQVPPISARAESGRRAAETLLQGVEEPEIVCEIGDLFVLRERWADAKYAFDRMIDLAAPHKEQWMAWGYEKLGLIHRKEEKWQLASECWRLAELLYRRTGSLDKAAEAERLLLDIPEEKAQAVPVTPPR